MTRTDPALQQIPRLEELERGELETRETDRDDRDRYRTMFNRQDYVYQSNDPNYRLHMKRCLAGTKIHTWSSEWVGSGQSSVA